jgi:hypothetical protein
LLQIRSRSVKSKVPEPQPAAADSSWGVVEGSFLREVSQRAISNEVMSYSLIPFVAQLKAFLLIGARSRG